MNRLIPLTALAAACASSQLTAAENRLEEVIVTSSRIEQPLRQVATSVSVMTREEIVQMGYNSLHDILRSQPAVSANNPGGAGNATSLFIRGENGYRTLVLLDGIDISDTSSTQHSPRIEHLLSSNIQRVEILRGPQGLMYGADAGGVVNISTLAPSEGLQGEVSAEGGRYGTQQLAASLSGGNDSVDFALSATDYETDGFNARSDDTVLRDDDGYENTTLHGRFGWNATEALRLELVVRDVDSENEYDNCFTVDTFARSEACSDDYEQQAWRVAASYKAGRFSNELAYSDSDTERQNYTEGRPSFGAEGGLEKTSYLGSFTANDSLRLVYGVDLQTESIDDGSFDTERDQDGYYLEYQGSFDDQVFITAGARYDDNDDFGSHTSYRISGAYLIPVSGGEMKFRATYGTGFRAPSLYEISYNSGPFAYPPATDSELSEEESEGYDIGVSWSANSGLYLEAVYFDQTVSDEIYWDQLNYSGYLQGDGDTDSSGVELIADWPVLDSLSLSGNYTYNDTETSTGSDRVFRPKHLANLGLDWQVFEGAVVFGLNVRMARDLIDVDGSDLDDYEVLDLNASWNVWRGLELYGRVENLLDEDYQERAPYNTSGAAAYAGVRYSF